MQLKIPSSRRINFLAFLLTTLAIVIAIYLEVAKQLLPCLLCIGQRIIFIALAALFFVAGFVNPQQRYARLLTYLPTGFIALLGVFLAGRHVWIQRFPSDGLISCSANANTIVHVLPPSGVLHLLFFGNGDCSKITWDFFGITLPEFALLLYLILLAVTLLQIFRK